MARKLLVLLTVLLAVGASFLAGYTVAAGRLRQEMDSQARDLRRDLASVSASLAETQERVAALAEELRSARPQRHVAEAGKLMGAAPGSAGPLRPGGAEPPRPDVPRAEARTAESPSRRTGAQAMEVGPVPGPQEPAPPPGGPTLRAGQELLLSAAHDEYPVAVDEGAYEDFLALAAARDTLGMAELAARGRLVILWPGTRVRILQAVGRPDPRVRLQVLSGPEEGASGWIQQPFLGL